MTKRPVFYFAVPLRPDDRDLSEVPLRRVEQGHGEYEPDIEFPIPEVERQQLGLRANVDRALRGLGWVRKAFPDVTFIAPWIAAVLSGENDANPAQREAGLVDACAIVERCTGIVLYGGRVSSGMMREMGHGQLQVVDFCVANFSCFREPPSMWFSWEAACAR